MRVPECEICQRLRYEKLCALLEHGESMAQLKWARKAGANPEPALLERLESILASAEIRKERTQAELKAHQQSHNADRGASW